MIAKLFCRISQYKFYNTNVLKHNRGICFAGKYSSPSITAHKRYTDRKQQHEKLECLVFFLTIQCASTSEMKEQGRSSQSTSQVHQVNLVCPFDATPFFDLYGYNVVCYNCQRMFISIDDFHGYTVDCEGLIIQMN